MAKHVKDNKLDLDLFWSTLFSLLLPIWPSRTTLPGHPDIALGDCWRLPSLAASLDPKNRSLGDDFVPFHKLTQWLCYSLVEAIESETGWKITSTSGGQTGLPEVRRCHGPLLRCSTATAAC